MHVCPECARTIEGFPGPLGPQICPHCRAELRRGASGAWADVARVTNLAEAGFLTDDLAGQGIDARIYQSDDFRGIEGRWATNYLIQVAASRAQEAAAHIRHHLADEDYRREMASETRARPVPRDSSSDSLVWRPVVLVMMAGVASFVLGQHFGDPARRPSRNSLSSAVNEIGRPLLTEPVPGQPRYRLSFDWRRDAWLLDADHTGDGIYDSRRQFQASGAGW